jgi:AraC-like DNA-binding protein
MTDLHRQKSPRRQERIWILRSTYLTAYLEALRATGADPSPMLEKHEIPPDFEFLTDYMIAADQLHSFIRDASRCAEPGAISTSAGLFNAAQQANPFRDSVGVSITLLDAIERHNASVAGYSPENVFDFTLADDSGQWRKLGISPIEEGEIFCVANLIGHVRSVLGLRWQPEAVGVSRTSNSVLERLPLYRGIPVLTSEEHTTVTIPKHWLAAPIRHPRTMTHKSGQVPITEVEDCDFVWSLRQLLRSYVRLGNTGIDSAADAAGLTRRTLQRRLADVGMTYSAVLDQARFEVARSMLIDSPETGITEISYEVGYQDPGSFSRAFRRLTGVSPRSYRLLDSDHRQAV